MQNEEQPSAEQAPAAFVKPNRPHPGRLVAGCVALSLGIVAGVAGIASATLGDRGGSSSASASRPAQNVTPVFRRTDDLSGSTAATAAQKLGVVTIVSTIDYDATEKAAGTGTILTASGYILTNNHVIEGATSIQVTVESTGTTYTATVVGTDVTDDVAVLKLTDASLLSTATYATSSAVGGDTVTAIGNAEGTGELVSATGTITATDQAITVQGDSTDQSENLSNLIETSADVVAGDSGGPLLNANGQVIGMDTAASSGTRQTIGYAIPIAEALTIARQIESGSASDTITIGYPAFLGVELGTSRAIAPAVSGALVAGVIAGTPAASAGIVAGDTVTAVDGTALANASALSALIASHTPGDRVTLSWTDSSGASHTAAVTLQSGPAA